MARLLALTAIVILMSACAAKFLKIDSDEKIGDIKEYDKKLKVDDIEKPKSVKETKPEPGEVTTTTIKRVYEQVAKPEEEKPKDKGKEKQKIPEKKEPPKGVTTTKKRIPDFEDGVGFNGRRPVVDPIRVGEKVVLEASYLGMTAGKITIETLPFKQVNGRKAYHFQVNAQTSSFFNAFYAVDDTAETFLDYEDLIPYNFAIHMKESKQLKEVRAYFDWQKKKAHYWEQKITKEKGEKTKKYEWDILPFSQNIFTGPMYFRMFHLEPGKKIKFRLADEKKNILVDADVLRREEISTPIGKLQTLVIRPQVQISGALKPMGDVLFWITDDDRKFIVKIDAKIKIGTIHARLVDLDPGPAQ
ncbi:MAG: DUF3108 domain-containing protein [Bdellovibrionales bacterium]|nr:DUF3108 domain-containing protein [Bdellovibrionales bacterium]